MPAHVAGKAEKQGRISREVAIVRGVRKGKGALERKDSMRKNRTVCGRIWIPLFVLCILIGGLGAEMRVSAFSLFPFVTQEGTENTSTREGENGTTPRTDAVGEIRAAVPEGISRPLGIFLCMVLAVAVVVAAYCFLPRQSHARENRARQKKTGKGKE